MRRLTDTEMEHLIALGRSGTKGPALAMNALWDLILQEVEGIGWDEAIAQGRHFNVQDYAIAADQATELKEGWLLRRHRSTRMDIVWRWFIYSPGTYDATGA